MDQLTEAYQEEAKSNFIPAGSLSVQESTAMNRRSLFFFSLAAVLLIAGAAAIFYYFDFFQIQNRQQTTSTTTSIQSSPPPSISTPTIASQSSYLTPLTSLKAVTGVAPSVVPVTGTSPVYNNTKIGLNIHYPQDWKVVEAPQQSGVAFYPPGADPNSPAPLIAFNFAQQQPYLDSPVLSHSVSRPQPVTVSGITGREYENSEFAIPTYDLYIELPYRGGILFITATKGPDTNLIPQLHEMLKAVVLQP
jgi:hypothetical protein